MVGKLTDNLAPEYMQKVLQFHARLIIAGEGIVGIIDQHAPAEV
jgi:hypothetical protein